jgi:hypothetical protein
MFAQRKSPRWLLVVSVILVVVGLALWLTPAAVSAQDGGVPESSGCSQPNESTCCTCHAQTHPVLNEGEWHAIHVPKQCCRNCHGGNDTTMDKDQAHVGMMSNPLDDIYLNCYPCHTDYEQRAQRFAAVLGVTPKSSQPITAAALLQPPSSERVPPPLVSTPAETTSAVNPILWVLIVLVGGLLAGLAITWRKLSHG